MTRREAIAPLVDESAWTALGGRLDVVVGPFAPAQPGRGTDLYEPLARAAESVPNLRAIVLASDGDWNEGQPPIQAAAALRAKDIPVFAVPVGSRSHTRPRMTPPPTSASRRASPPASC